MSKEPYTIENVSRHLNSLPGITIQKTTIKINQNVSVGIKVLGKINFLKSQGFNVVYSSSTEANKRTKEDFEVERPVKRRKHKSGIDAVSSVKNAMKGINIKIKK